MRYLICVAFGCLLTVGALSQSPRALMSALEYSYKIENIIRESQGLRAGGVLNREFMRTHAGDAQRQLDRDMGKR